MINIFSTIVSTVLSLHLNRMDIHQPLTDSKILLSGHAAISQTFHSRENDLNIVSICLRNPTHSTIPLVFTLHEATISAAPIRSLDFSAANITESDCTRFQFIPVIDSAARDYVVGITVRPETLEIDKLGIYAESYAASDDVIGNAFVDGTKLGSDLHFKTFYRANLWHTVQGSISQFITRLGQDFRFILPYTLILLMLIYQYWRVGKK